MTSKIKKTTNTDVVVAKKTTANVANETPNVVTASGAVLVKKTNVPWRRKFYFVDEKVYAETEELRKTKASQIQLMLKSMVETKKISAETSAMGDKICSDAIAGGLKTKISPPVLFAYYRKDMEQLGLVFAGYNMTQA